MLRPLMLNSLKCFKNTSICTTYYSTKSCGSKKVAVVLSGCGVLDGTEIHEASSVLIHLTRGGAITQCYAPDVEQMHVVDHRKGCPDECAGKRNVLVESARIARGKISPLSELAATKADALVFPGGFGVAKNLCNFAVEGANCCVNPEVEKVLKDFHCAKKPIGFVCISPILAAKVFECATITLGKKDDGSGKWPHAGAIDAAIQMGANVEEKDVNDFVYDEKNRILSTPAFMYDGKFFEIYDGIGCMIKKLLALLK